MNLDSLSQELDRLYEFEIEKYVARCEELKKSGYKIFRNSKGMHKVVVAGSGTKKEPREFYYEDKSVKKNDTMSKAKKWLKTRVKNFIAVVNFIKELHASQREDRWNDK